MSELMSIPLFIVTLSWYMTEEQVEDIEVSLNRFFSIQEDLPLILTSLIGLTPVDLSIPMLLRGYMVGKLVCWF